MALPNIKNDGAQWNVAVFTFSQDVLIKDGIQDEHYRSNLQQSVILALDSL